jgi:hypothetical protein
VNLHYDIKKQITEIKRAVARFENYLEKAIKIDDILQNINSKDKKIHSQFRKVHHGICGSLIDRISK